MHCVAILEKRIIDQWEASGVELSLEESWVEMPEVCAKSMLKGTMVLFGAKARSGYSRNSILEDLKRQFKKDYPKLKGDVPKIFEQEMVGGDISCW